MHVESSIMMGLIGNISCSVLQSKHNGYITFELKMSINDKAKHWKRCAQISGGRRSRCSPHTNQNSNTAVENKTRIYHILHPPAISADKTKEGSESGRHMKNKAILWSFMITQWYDRINVVWKCHAHAHIRRLHEASQTRPYFICMCVYHVEMDNFCPMRYHFIIACSIWIQLSGNFDGDLFFIRQQQGAGMSVNMKEWNSSEKMSKYELSQHHNKWMWSKYERRWLAL